METFIVGMKIRGKDKEICELDSYEDAYKVFLEKHLEEMKKNRYLNNTLYIQRKGDNVKLKLKEYLED